MLSVITGGGMCVSAAVNECEEGIDNCDAIAECRDLPDGFECICPTGFTGDGITCDGRHHRLTGA
jgi:hypothetical protein